MDLLEYQAKELFHQIGIPILPSQTIADPSELKRLQIRYPVVLKSQVRAGGRGRAGGIRFVENTIDAIAAARTIFNLPIMGEYPEFILAEARYDAQQEFFLAVLLDYQLKRPVLLGSTRGGIDLDTLLEHMQKVVIDEDFSPFYARRLAIKMGLRGALIQSVSAIIEKIYHLFSEKDLDLVEINPLGVSADGELMALDGKITVNDSAIKRHLDIERLTVSKKQPSQKPSSELEAPSSAIEIPEPRWLDRIDEKGNIGILSNSLGLAMATWDLIVQDKGKPACCLIVGEATNGKWLPDGTLTQQLGEAIELALEVKGLKVVLVNLLGSVEAIEMLGQALADYLQPHIGQTAERTSEERAPRATSAVSPRRLRNLQSRSGKSQANEPPQFVIRLGAGESESVKERLTTMPVFLTDDLDDAIAQTLSIAKSK
ncbi:ATPase [Hydrococcus rivularis NIES-593]|uniref:ATPase n=1 Tax=Hydrococcus rivularis NIES-593 TaxID=1921803 RepID=A0A1U7HKU4_9CYAN|nr:ATP-grasp domain-containing protein [Hydrococcus rivularis]OKH24206.1 ATPase [Hydrococcus rivularis NIES-593]